MVGKTIQFGESLVVTDAPRREYAIGFELLTQDPGDYLSLAVQRGAISVFVNGQWQAINGDFSFQPNGQMPDNIRIRVDSQAQFSIRTIDSYSYWPYDDAPTNPAATIALDPRLDVDMGDRTSRAWNMGIIDPLTRLSWQESIVSPGPQAGIKVVESIGGDEVSDYVQFRLTRRATLNIQTEGAIAQLIKSGLVVVDSNDGYSSNLTVTLSRGTYFLGFSSESSMAEAFVSNITFV